MNDRFVQSLSDRFGLTIKVVPFGCLLDSSKLFLLLCSLLQRLAGSLESLDLFQGQAAVGVKQHPLDFLKTECDVLILLPLSLLQLLLNTLSLPFLSLLLELLLFCEFRCLGLFCLLCLCWRLDKRIKRSGLKKS